MCRDGLLAVCSLLCILVSCSEGIRHSKTYLGCFKDGIPRALPNYYGGTGGTVMGCYKKAIELGYKVFAVQNGGECWLDDTKENKFHKHGLSDKCADGLGGQWANSVYSVKTSCQISTLEGKCCVFPFIYDGTKYYTCTKETHNKLWCATTSNYGKDHEWGNCRDPCEPGWKYFGDHCYQHVEAERLEWEDSEDHCKSMDAALAQINTMVENDFVFRTFAKDVNVWLGLRRSEGDFYWTDGSEPRFTAWNSAEPNNRDKKENCVELSHYSGRWNDVRCSKRLAYVCKKGF